MEKKLDLAQFSGGTNEYWTHPLFPNLKYTDGVKHVAKEFGAYWLIENVLSHQCEKKFKSEDFQVWTLRVSADDHTASLVADDGNHNKLYTEKIDYTDFPVEEFAVWLVGNVLLLPCEY